MKKCQLTTMVSVFKSPRDSKIPTERPRLEDRYMLTCNQCEDEKDRLTKPGERAVVDGKTATIAINERAE